MVFQNPELRSLIGDAKLVRHVYLSGLAVSHVVWTANLTGGGDRFIHVALGAAYGDDRVIPIPAARVENFYVLEGTTPNVGIFVYDDGDNLWKFTYNFSTLAVVSQPERLYAGTVPALASDASEVKPFYLRDQAVQLREGFTGGERTLVDPSAGDILDQDFMAEISGQVANYAGLHAPAVDLALPLRDADAIVLYNFESETTVPGMSQVIDSVGNPAAVNFDVIGVPSIVPGKVGDALEFDGGPALSREVHSQIGQFGTERSICMGLYGRADKLPANATGLVSGVNLGGYSHEANVHAPWTNSNFYWDCGADAGGYDRINWAEDPAYFEGRWTHWIFTKGGGTMAAYRDNVLRSSATGKSRSLSPLQSFSLVGVYYGYVDEVLWIDRLITTAERAYIYGQWAAGDPINPASIPDLNHYWKFDAGSVRAVEDLSGNGFHLAIYTMPIVGGLVFIPADAFVPYIEQWTVPSSITIEAWFVPRMNEKEALILDGPIVLGYKSDGSIFFEFDGANRLEQTGLHKLIQHEKNHVLVSHSFGDGSGTFLAINGKPVYSEWTTGNKAAIPSWVGSGIDSTLALGDYDILKEFKISDVFTTQGDLLEYMKGRR